MNVSEVTDFLPTMATVLTLVSGDIVVEEDIKVVQAHIERRAALMSLTDAATGTRVLISPAHVEKLIVSIVSSESPPDPATPFPLWAAQSGSPSGLLETPGGAPAQPA